MSLRCFFHLDNLESRIGSTIQKSLQIGALNDPTVGLLSEATKRLQHPPRGTCPFFVDGDTRLVLQK
jgi:hypothetical protein